MAAEPFFACRVVRGLPGFRLAADLTAHEGEVLALFGASGSGKTMTLGAVAGTVRPDAGRITVGASVLFDSAQGIDLPAQQRRTGYVPQSYALFPHLTVAENIAIGLRGRARSDRAAAVNDLLSRLRLDGLADRLPRQLSGGQQQRVALARALAIGPQILLLDEPFAALDAGLRAELREELAALRREFPVTTVLVTHDLGDVHALADRVAVFSGGNVVQMGSKDEVFHQPVSVEVARLTGNRNVLTGQRCASGDGLAVQLPDGQALWAGAAVGETTGGAVSVVLRPEYLRLIAEGEESDIGEDESVLRGDVERTLSQGATVTVWVRLRSQGPVIEVSVPAREWRNRPWTAGQRVQVAVPRWAVWMPTRDASA